jgi:hypothetical protein
MLVHELPDGSSHVDWLIARPDADSLASFRLDGRVDQLRPGKTLVARRVADHRPEWLDREGTVSGGRGTARRLARGSIHFQEVLGTTWHLEIVWEGKEAVARQRLRLEPMDPQRGNDGWRVTAVS